MCDVGFLLSCRSVLFVVCIQLLSVTFCQIVLLINQLFNKVSEVTTLRHFKSTTVNLYSGAWEPFFNRGSRSKITCQRTQRGINFLTPISNFKGSVDPLTRTSRTPVSTCCYYYVIHFLSLDSGLHNSVMMLQRQNLVLMVCCVESAKWAKFAQNF